MSKDEENRQKKYKNRKCTINMLMAVCEEKAWHASSATGLQMTEKKNNNQVEYESTYHQVVLTNVDDTTDNQHLSIHAFPHSVVIHKKEPTRIMW